MNKGLSILVFGIVLFSIAAITYAFTAPTYIPGGGTSPSLEDVYDLITIGDTNATDDKQIEPIANPDISPYHSLNDIWDVTVTERNKLSDNLLNSVTVMGVGGTIVDCTADNNSGYCYIDAASKGAVDSDLAAGNILNGIDIFGVSGGIPDCTTDNSGYCYIDAASKSAVDSDLAAGNIRYGITIFGITGAY